MNTGTLFETAPFAVRPTMIDRRVPTVGDDIHQWTPMQGVDVIIEAPGTNGGTDLLIIDIDRDRVEQRRGDPATNPDDLVLVDRVTGATLTIHDHFARQDPFVGEIEFADGTVLRAPIHVGGQIRGHNTDDLLVGVGGRDEIFDGGLGDDDMYGGAGEDTYLWNGNDRIFESPASDPAEVDRLYLPTVYETDVAFDRVGNDLIATKLSTGERLSIIDHFAGPGGGIDEFQFRDQITRSRAEIEDRLSAKITGTDGDDRVSGSAARDVIDGGRGNDRIDGGAGSDEYLWGTGYGYDIITERGYDTDTDYVTLTNLNRRDVTLSNEGFYGDLVITVNATGERLTVASNFYTEAGRQRVEAVRFADGETLIGDALDYAAFRRGTAGDDALRGNAGSDSFLGGQGDDILIGGYGSDNYTWRSGDGNDLIEEYGASRDVDRLHFTDHLAHEVEFHRVTASPSGYYAYDLPIISKKTGEAITLTNGASDAISASIDRFVFANGTELLRRDVLQDVAITGTHRSDMLYGMSRNDEIFDGRGGADLLRGGAGNDVYLWRKGDGNDQIYDSGSGTDVDAIQFLDVNYADVELSVDGYYNSLIIHIKPTGEEIRVDYNFVTTDGRYGVEELRFADGTVLGGRDLFIDAALIEGTAGNDFLTGGLSRDVYDGGLGNDLIRDMRGADTYLYDSGDGFDVIEDYGSWSPTDSLLLVNLNSTDVSFVRSVTGIYGSQPDLLVIDNMTGQWITVKGNTIEQFEFANGVTLDRDAAMDLAPIHGSGGRDTLHGRVEKGETFEGFAGNDWIYAYGKADTFIWSRGDGNDWIQDYDGISGGTNVDRLVLNGVREQDVVLQRSPSGDLWLSVGDERLTVSRQFSDDRYGIEELVLANTTLTPDTWTVVA